MPGVHQGPVARVGFLQRCVGAVAGARHHPGDGQVEDLGELEVPLVVARNGHDGAGAVLDEDVVGDPDGDGGAGGRVRGTWHR